MHEQQTQVSTLVLQQRQQLLFYGVTQVLHSPGSTAADNTIWLLSQVHQTLPLGALKERLKKDSGTPLRLNHSLICFPARLLVCRSFTVGQLQAHKHRLAASTPARSCSPPGTSHDPCCSHNRRCNKCGPQRQRPAVSAPGLRLQGSGGSVCSYTHKPLAVTYSGGAYPDARLMSSSGGSLPLRGLLLAENVSVQDVGKVCVVCWLQGPGREVQCAVAAGPLCAAGRTCL